MTMTPQENLMAVLSGGAPRWLPVCMHIANANNLPGFLPRRLLREPLDRLAISEFVGGDILYEIPAVHTRLSADVRIETTNDADGRRSTLATPAGVLTEQMVFARADSPSYDDIPADYEKPGPVVTSVHARHFIGGPEDYRVLQSFYEAQQFAADNDAIAQEKQRLGDNGVLVLGGGPSSPLYALASSHAGIERLTYDLLDAPDQVEAAMNALQQAACRWYRAAATAPCDVIRCTEDLDTKLISPTLFRQYAVPALRQYARICHEHGKLFVVHMCGHVRDFLADIRDIGADAIHCLTPPPTGNTTVAQARELLAGRTAALLRIDPDLLLHGDNERLDRYVDDICRQAGDWRRLLIIIPCGRAPLNNIRRVIEQARKKGAWA